MICRSPDPRYCHRLEPYWRAWLRRHRDKGFGEAPQAAARRRARASFAGPVSAWAEAIAEGGEREGRPKRRVKGRGDPTLSDRSLPLSPRQARKAAEDGARHLDGRPRHGASERAGAGLMPVAGLDVTLEDAEALPQAGVTATVQALSELIEKGRPEFRDKTWVPHRPPRPEKSEGGVPLRIVSEFEPKGDQPQAIEELVEGIRDAGERTQVLLGVTGSGKTFTMAKVIEATQRPALILAPNKTLAAQLYGEFKSFFPDNAVEYFVSYYDYYQPEAYVPRTDTYIEKESSINEQIDRMRHSATRSLLERDDVDHRRLRLLHLRHRLGRDLHGDDLRAGGRARRQPAPGARRPRRAAIQAHRHRISSAARSACAATRSSSSRRTWRTAPGASPSSATRSSRSSEFDPLTGQKTGDLKSVKVYANSHYVTPEADAAAGDQGHPRGAASGGSTSSTRPGACSRRSGSRSARSSTSR